MQIIGTKKTQSIDALGEGSISLLPVDPEDMWHANNLIRPEDKLRAHAIRKVVEETATGSTSSKRVHTELTLSVTATFFDPAASALRVTGVVVVENAYVSLGQYHTLDLELHRPFTLWKKDGWDSVALEELKESLRQDKDGAVAAVVMDDGHANICLITQHRTVLKQRVTGSLSKKLTTSADLDPGTRRFFEKLLSTLLRSVDFDEPRVLLLASPGYTAQNFKRFISNQSAQTADKVLRRIASDAVVVHCSTGNIHSLNEVLKSPEVTVLLKDKKFRTDTKCMDDFLARLRKDESRAAYGTIPVEKAVAEGAVGRGGGVLLINNALFRSQEIATRKRYVAIVDKVKADGGELQLFSSDHESGQRLDSLGGIAAMLTYPMHDLDEDDGGDGDRDEGDNEGYDNHGSIRKTEKGGDTGPDDGKTSTSGAVTSII